MSWGSAGDFFAMGGYGLYVWGSYAVCLLAMVLEPWLVARRHERARQDARRAQEEMEFDR